MRPPTTLPRLRAATPMPRPCPRCRLQSLLLRPARPQPLSLATISSSWLRTTPSTIASFSHSSRLRSESPQTHYDLFPSTLPSGPPPSGPFPIDTRALRREFLQLQARAHPDLQPAESKAAAETLSAHINDAYRTLSSPLLRAQYLLSLRGVDVAEDETLKVEEPDLLMTVLEAREEIEEAENEEDLEAPRATNNERIRESEAILDRAFADDDVEAAKREAVRLRYWINIQDSLDNWEPGKPVVLQH